MDSMDGRSILGWLGALALALALASTAGAADDPAIPGPDVSLLAWTPAQQAWGYRNMEKVYPVKVIARGGEVHPLPAAPAPIDPSFAFRGKTYDTAAYMAAFRASGVLVIKDGRIVLERYAMGRGPDER